MAPMALAHKDKSGRGARAATADRWRLVWSDEFDGPGLDRTKWDTERGNGFFDYRRHEWVPGWGNEELQYYTDDAANLCVKDSLLHLRALKESLHGCGYTSARIKTRRRDGMPLFNKRYGKFEFRAKVPHGKGLWPAIWMLPQDDTYGAWAASGEIDVMEIAGERPHEYLGSLHFGSTAPKRSLVTHVHAFADGGTVADFHVYAVEWEPGEIRWLVDGVVWARQTFWWSCKALRNGRGIEARNSSDLNPWPAPFDQPFYIIMNVAVGGDFPGVPNAATRFPAELIVDYVRVYDRVGGYGEAGKRGAGRLPYQRGRRR
ncbi:MAG: glycoside hydrolase family 16 protein [Gammaproteobacteria bacterium]|nr:glycoside hydrolase family 16 protein [Gammaproteobacteria bacterium]